MDRRAVLVALSAWLPSSAVCAASDPLGDAAANPPPLAQQLSLDLTRADVVTAFMTPGFYFNIRFAQRIRAPSEAAALGGNPALTARAAIGYLELDLDDSVLTGVPPRQNLLSPPFETVLLGVDGWLDLTSEATTPGMARFILPSGWPGSGGSATEVMVAVNYRYRSITGFVDLEGVPGAAFDPLFPARFTALIGNPLNYTDALNGPGETFFIPGPGASALIGAGLLATIHRRR